MARQRREPTSPSARWFRSAASLGVLIVCVVSSHVGNSWLLEKWSDLEQWILRASGSRPPSGRQNLTIGFSGHAPLGSMQLLRSVLDEQIAVRVVSDRPPGYLRGAAFERYTSRGWEFHSDWIPISRSRKPLPAVDHVADSPKTAGTSPPIFWLRESAGSKLRPITIWRTPALDQFTFLPLSTSRLQAPTELLILDRHSVVGADNVPSEVGLTAWVPDSSNADLHSSHVSPIEPIIQPKQWEPGMPWELDRLETLEAKVRLRQLPNRLVETPELLRLATQVFAGCETPQDKVVAVERHLATHRYGTSIAVPPRADPVTYFLLERPPAHCEFFASATAILLRMGGVPCRYVTGYAGGEYNVLGKYWIVRQRDAHAWIEAYLPEEGWVVVDSTPAGHMPATVTSFGLWQLWDDLTLRGQMIRTALAGESWAGKWVALKLVFLTLLTTIPGVLITGGLVFLVVRNLKFARDLEKSEALEPAVIELRRLLEELDRRLRRLDLEREAHETLHQFAERLCIAASSHPNLQEAADWYLHYAATRYGRSLQADAQDALRAELQTVCARLSERQKRK